MCSTAIHIQNKQAKKHAKLSKHAIETSRKLMDSKSSESVNKSVDFLKHWTMRKSRYGEAEGGGK